jgi:hypothetical protein
MWTSSFSDAVKMLRGRQGCHLYLHRPSDFLLTTEELVVVFAVRVVGDLDSES